MDKEEPNRVPMMLVTANVGSIFEDPTVALKIWTSEFLKVIKEMKPLFLAVHCQEFGGKNYEESMKHFDVFLNTLLESEELGDYQRSTIFVDDDFTSSENFTALASLYFSHNSLPGVCLWDFKEKLFVPMVGRKMFSSNTESVSMKEKAKFPQEFYPQCKWSRKGFIRTRWKIQNMAFDLVNIHLFHDASNLVSIKAYPSPYTETRQHALKYTLERFEKDELENLPLFVFGDFNFRPDVGAVIRKLTNNASPLVQTNETDGEIHIFQSDTSPSIKLTVGKKLFDLEDQDIFKDPTHYGWLRDYDKELDVFKTELYEFKIEFAPTYPFNEGTENTSYMKTRCPAWCDRILMNNKACLITKMEGGEQHGAGDTNTVYNVIGNDKPMGDHKPVFLKFIAQVN